LADVNGRLALKPKQEKATFRRIAAGRTCAEARHARHGEVDSLGVLVLCSGIS